MKKHHENPFQYLRGVLNELEHYAANLAKEYGAEHLAGPQGCAILHLLKNDGEDLSFKDMEAALQLSKSVTSNLLKRMEKNGFIEIVPAETDKRIKYVVLTPFGRQKAANMQDFLDYLHAVFMKNLSKEDFEVVWRVLRQLQENIHQEREEKR